MARIRSIKPSFFLDSELSQLSPMARLFFIGLWCLADREGRLKDKPMELGVQLIPYDLAKNNPIDLLKELDGKFVIRYEVEGKKYLLINGFKKHQRPATSEPASDLPKPNIDIHATNKNVVSVSCDEQKGQERKGKEGKGKEGNGVTAKVAVELVDNAKPVDWSKCNTELQSFMAYYIKEEMPAIYKSGTQSQVSGLFKRFGRPASELLSIAGSLPIAIRVFELSRAFYNKKGLSWNLSTVLANSGDFLNQALQEKINGNGK